MDTHTQDITLIGWPPPPMGEVPPAGWEGAKRGWVGGRVQIGWARYDARQVVSHRWSYKYSLLAQLWESDFFSLKHVFVNYLIFFYHTKTRICCRQKKFVTQRCAYNEHLLTTNARPPDSHPPSRAWALSHLRLAYPPAGAPPLRAGEWGPHAHFHPIGFMRVGHNPSCDA